METAEPLPKTAPSRITVGSEDSGSGLAFGLSVFLWVCSIPGLLLMARVIDYDLPESAPAATLLLGGVVAITAFFDYLEGDEMPHLERTPTQNLQHALRTEAHAGDKDYSITLEKHGIGGVMSARTPEYLRRRQSLHGAAVLAVLVLLAAVAALAVLRTLSDDDSYGWVDELEQGLEHSEVLEILLQYGAAVFAGAAVYMGVKLAILLASGELSIRENGRSFSRAEVLLTGDWFVALVSTLSRGAVRMSRPAGVAGTWFLLLAGGGLPFVIVAYAVGAALTAWLLPLVCCCGSVKAAGKIVVAATFAVWAPAGVIASACVAPELLFAVLLLLSTDSTDASPMFVTVPCLLLQYVRVALLLAYGRASFFYWAVAGGTGDGDSLTGPLALEAVLLIVTGTARVVHLGALEDKAPGSRGIPYFGWWSVLELPLVPAVAVCRWLRAPVREVADQYFEGRLPSSSSQLEQAVATVELEKAS